VTRAWLSLASAFEVRCLRYAMKQLGAPYIWGGKVDQRFDVTLGLRPWADGELRPGRRAFDCSGLVLCAVRETTAIDARGRWNAQSMHDATREWEALPRIHAALRFYGSTRTGIQHIAYAFESRADLVPQCLVLEAAGAGKDATSETVARSKGAEVRYVEDKRDDLISSVPLWALGVSLGAVERPPETP
jgi:hypothetical protein